MRRSRLALGLTVVLFATVAYVPADERPGVQHKTPTPGTERVTEARPAILIVPTWESPGAEQAPAERTPSKRIEDQRSARQAARQPAARRMARPEVAAGYELVGRYRPNPLAPQLQYFVYMDLRDPAVAENWRRLYRAQRAEVRNQQAEERGRRDMVRRRQRLLRTHAEAVAAGTEQMRAGEYRQALLAFTLAAELDHGDPGCRIHMGLTRLALGHDLEAAKAVRRALELQPKLVPIPLKLDQYFPSVEEFDEHVEALRERLEQNPRPTADEYFLLGFLEFQRGRFDEAHAAFTQARRGFPKDERLTQFLTLTKPAGR